MKDDCVFLEAEPIGGTDEYIQYGYYCRKHDLYNDDIHCEKCKDYDKGDK